MINDSRPYDFYPQNDSKLSSHQDLVKMNTSMSEQSDPLGDVKELRIHNLHSVDIDNYKTGGEYALHQSKGRSKPSGVTHYK